MFDIGFTEILVIGVVALVVLGPERLPAVARTLGHLFGRMQRYVHDVKTDIQRELELEELKKLRQSVEDSARQVETSVRHEIDTVQADLNAFEAAIDPTRPLEPAPVQPGATDTPAAAATGSPISSEPATPLPSVPILGSSAQAGAAVANASPPGAGAAPAQSSAPPGPGSAGATPAVANAQAMPQPPARGA